MTKNLLLVTGDAGLADGMQQGIGQAGYRLLIARHLGEAVVFTEEEDCSVALLDLDVGERSVIEVGRALRTVKPNVNLILFSDADTPPALDQIRPWVLM